jgi:hypothetical protein
MIRSILDAVFDENRTKTIALAATAAALIWFGVIVPARAQDVWSDWSTSPSWTIALDCSFAIIAPDGSTTVDWRCAEKFAAKLKDRPANQWAAVATMMLAIRDKTATRPDALIELSPGGCVRDGRDHCQH